MIYIHLGALLFLIGIIIFADKQVFSWVRGKKGTLSLKTLRMLHTLVWAGLIAMVLSGTLLSLPLTTYLFQTPAFYIKMFFVLALVVNSFFIGTFMNVAATKPFAELTRKEKFPILISGAVSTIAWFGAFISALFMSTSQWILFFLSKVF